MRQNKSKALSSGKFSNSGNGPLIQLIDIGHKKYVAAIEPETAFWSLIEKNDISNIMFGDELLGKFKKYEHSMMKEIHSLRFGLKPSAVYFNPTEQCNLNCPYCYIPERMRRNGTSMPWKRMDESLRVLKNYFTKHIPKKSKPQIVFHGSEPLVNKDNIFKAIETFGNDFHFGIQTNGTLMEQEDFDFLSNHRVAIGISIDGHNALTSDKTRLNWNKQGTFKRVLKTLEICKGYPHFSVICTVTNNNVRNLVKIIEFLHSQRVENCLLNQVRCTLKGAREIKPTDHLMAKMFIQALDKIYSLYQKTGRKMIVANFANILISIIAPSARRLMCDISPCGAGRCFFALSTKGEIFPCSEFIGLPEFKGGNIFKDDLEHVLLGTEAFKMVTNRKIENITPCNRCAIRHFCGSPCPAEAHEIHGEINQPGAFCEFYEEQVRYAFKTIADGKEKAYLWDEWDKDTKNMFHF